MKKLLISTLILVASIATQIQSHFIRGAIYKNEKTGQLIVFIADKHFDGTLIFDKNQQEHFKKTKAQRDQFIEEVKKLEKKSSLVLVEDSENSDETTNKNNKKYQLATKFIDFALSQYKIDNQDFSPINFLLSDLLKNNVNVENLECRYMEETLQEEAQMLFLFKMRKQEIPSQQVSTEDVVNEIEQNILNLKKQLKEAEKYKCNYSEKEFSKIVDYFKESVKYVEEGFDEYIKILRILKIQINEMPQEKVRPVIDLFKRIKEANTFTNFVFLDANIIDKILKNNDKKIIVICAGFAHTSRIEHFISDLGYKLIKESGVKIITKQACFDQEKMSKEVRYMDKINPAHINFRDLFANLDLQLPQDKLLEKESPHALAYEQRKTLLKQINKILLSKEKAPVSIKKMLTEVTGKTKYRQGACVSPKKQTLNFGSGYKNNEEKIVCNTSTTYYRKFKQNLGCKIYCVNEYLAKHTKRVEFDLKSLEQKK